MSPSWAYHTAIHKPSLGGLLRRLLWVDSLSVFGIGEAGSSSGSLSGEEGGGGGCFIDTVVSGAAPPISLMLALIVLLSAGAFAVVRRAR